ncbi:MAG: palindromic element RPE5 domain-containing protein [Rickettsia endosymbiont of Eriopis connexa]|nr:palindromic element RPE5 domain-containing protein [Rickettsia endosymbiont of Eriopis connexa]
MKSSDTKFNLEKSNRSVS